MEALLSLTNGVIAALCLVLAVVVWESARRLGASGSRLVVVLGLYFLVQALERFAGPQAPILPNSTALTITLDVLTLLLLTLVLVESGRLVAAVAARHRQSQWLSERDSLTGLRNRDGWLRVLEKETLRAARSSNRFAVAIVDLDHFKAFNDQRGHLAGDDFLVKAASAWRNQLRHHDTLGRYGGEEFGVILPECPAMVALQIGERLRAATPRRETCSIGIAIWDGRESPRELVRRADQALYRAKTKGRDRVELDRMPLGRPPTRGPGSASQPRDQHRSIRHE